MVTFDVDVVGRLLVIQEFLETLPAEQQIAAFVRDQLRQIPGIVEVGLCLRGTLYPPNPALDEFCARSAELANTPAAFSAPPIDGPPHIAIVPLATQQHLCGFLAIELREGRDPTPYDRLFRTTARYVAQVMHTRDEIDLLGKADAMIHAVRDEVEARVHEQTADLSRRFDELTAEIARREQAGAVLRKSEDRLRGIAAAAQDAIVVIDESDAIQFWNPAAERLTGYSAEEAIGKRLHTWLVPERFRTQAAAGIQHFTATGQGPVIGKVLELAATRKDGSEFPVELTVAALPWNDGWGAVGVMRDVSERKQAEDALQRAMRALATLSAGNRALIHATTEEGLYDAMCRAVVETGGYRMAWIGVAQDDAAKSVLPVASAGHVADYFDTTAITWADDERGRGPTGTAIRTGNVQVNQDFAHNPALAPWRDAAIERGYGSSIALPLRADARVFGALTIYAAEPDAFDEREIALLKEMADDLSFGLNALRTRAERVAAVQGLQRSLEETIQALSSTIEIRDQYTAGHQRRVAELAAAIAKEMGLSEDRIHGLRLAAIVHDLGKVHIPAEILTKPGTLSAIEWELIKTHPQVGYDILKAVQFPWPIAQMVLQHHERLDGSGYPNGLKGDAILLETRILSVADVMEAMNSHRPYRPTRGIDAALAELRTGSGSRYDPAVVEALLRVMAAGSINVGAAVAPA